MAPELKHLQVELQRTPLGVIAWLTLNRPKALNALSGELLKELLQLLDSWDHPYSLIGEDATLSPDAPRVIILQGAGPIAFSSGMDVKVEWQGRGVWDWLGATRTQGSTDAVGEDASGAGWPPLAPPAMPSRQLRFPLLFLLSPFRPRSIEPRLRRWASAAAPGTSGTCARSRSCRA